MAPRAAVLPIPAAPVASNTGAPVVAHVTWGERSGLGPIRLRRSAAERDLIGTTRFIFGVRADGVALDTYGAPARGVPRVELPALAYAFERQGRELVTMIAVLRAGGYEIDRAPASSSRPRWTPVAEGTALFASQADAQTAGEVAFKIRKVPTSKRPAPLFTV